MRLGGPQHTKPVQETPAAEDAPVRGARLWRAGALLWALLVVVGSMLPPKTIASAMPHFPNADKFLHVGAYAVLGLLAVWGWSKRGWLGLGAVVLLFGIAIEFFQPLTGRSRSGLDMLADAAGVACGIVAAHMLGAAWKRWRRGSSQA